MNFVKTALATAAIAASFGATAQVTGSLGGSTTGFLSLSVSSPAPCAPCTLGPGVATIVGGTTYAADRPFAHMPAGGVFQNRFLAAGPTSTQPSLLTFLTPVDYISFLWGSPEMDDVLTVNFFLGAIPLSQSFTATGLGFSVTNGDLSFAQYVEFEADAGVAITGLLFSNNPGFDAFEVANFSVTPTVSEPDPRSVPEPGTYALMLAGLGALSFVGLLSRKNGPTRLGSEPDGKI